MVNRYMKTAVLFICHEVCKESMFRHGLLKQACDKMGYDLFWMVDSNNLPREFPPNIQFHEFSFERFEKLTNLKPYVVQHRPNITRKNSTATTATQLFMLDTSFQYDRVWHVEYDVCFMGDWVDFFKQYEDVNADFITTWNYERPEYDYDWYHFKFIDSKLKTQLQQSPFFQVTLNCLCRLSKRLLVDIRDYLTQIGSSQFQEWVFPTVANMKGYQTLFFSSNCFRPNKVKGFSKYRKGMVYHPLKLDVSFQDMLRRYANG